MTGFLIGASAVAIAASARSADIRVFTVSSGLPSNVITALAATPEGKLWVGTADAGAYLLDPSTGQGKGYRASAGLPSDEVASIALFGGKVFVGTSYGLGIFDGKKWENVSTVGNVTMRNVRLGVSPDGKQLWACSVYLAGGTVRFDGKAWTFMGGEGRGLFNDIAGFAFLPEGVLMGSGSGTAFVHRGNDVSGRKEGLPPVNVFAAGAYRGKAMLGTSRGLFEFRDSWVEVPLPREFSGRDSAVFALETQGEVLYVGGAGGLAKISGPNVAMAPGLPSPRVRALAATRTFVAAGPPAGLAILREW